MSFDAFEARLHFLQLLRKLTAKVDSIQKVTHYALKYGSRIGVDLWECITEECSKGHLNTRINILYAVDSLLEICQALTPTEAPYPVLVVRDLGRIVEGVVPDTREGVLNLKSTKQILDSWRVRRLVDPQVVDDALHILESREVGPSAPKKRTHEESFSKADIINRMEQDRERHKGLREKIWILPIPSLIAPTQTTRLPRTHALTFQSPSSTSPATPASPSSRRKLPGTPGLASDRQMPPPPVPASVTEPQVQIPSALEVEFETTWENEMDLDGEDLALMELQTYMARSQST